MILNKVKFIKSAPNKMGWIDDGVKEIVLLGRSNVGKSTFLNTLTGQKSLAKVSSRPGKTRLLNFFDVNDGQCRLVDAPGYGYACIPADESMSFGTMMSEYLSNRKNLAGAFLLLDARRIPNGDDLNIFDILTENHIPFVIVTTKYDKLNQSERAQLDRNIRAELGISDEVEIVHTSSETNTWQSTIISKINQFSR